VRHDKAERLLQKILKGEGILATDYGIQHSPDLTNWQTLFKDLKRHYQHVIIECEDLEEPLFLIGPIQRINKNTVSIWYYHADGKFDPKPTTVPYTDITLIAFADRYITTFRKYIKEPT